MFYDSWREQYAFHEGRREIVNNFRKGRKSRAHESLLVSFAYFPRMPTFLSFQVGGREEGGEVGAERKGGGANEWEAESMREPGTGFCSSLFISLFVFVFVLCKIFE